MKKTLCLLSTSLFALLSCSGSGEPKPKDKLISLYDANSKLYILSLDSNVASMRTFHHKDDDDVPDVYFM